MRARARAVSIFSLSMLVYLPGIKVRLGIRISAHKSIVEYLHTKALYATYNTNLTEDRILDVCSEARIFFDNRWYSRVFLKYQ